VIICTPNETCDLLTVSPSQLALLRKQDDFPAPLKIGARKLAWSLDELVDWLESRPRARSDHESV